MPTAVTTQPVVEGACAAPEGTLPAEEAHLRLRQLELLEEAAALTLTAWERVHEADAVLSRLQTANAEAVERGGAPRVWDAIGFEDAVADLAATVGRLRARVLQPSMRALRAPRRGARALCDGRR